jgi:hypothetical protein
VLELVWNSLPNAATVGLGVCVVMVAMLIGFIILKSIVDAPFVGGPGFVFPETDHCRRLAWEVNQLDDGTDRTRCDVLNRMGWTRLNDQQWRGDRRFAGLSSSEATSMIESQTNDQFPTVLNALILDYLRPVNNPWVARSRLKRQFEHCVDTGDFVGEWAYDWSRGSIARRDRGLRNFRVGIVVDCNCCQAIVVVCNDCQTDYRTVRWSDGSEESAHCSQLYVRIARDPPPAPIDPVSTPCI